MGQQASAESGLASVLSRWIRRERLRPADIERAAGVTRAHLWLITTGKVSRPMPETLRKIAQGLATDPDTGEVDRLKRDQALMELSAAAGYPETGDADADELAHAIRAVVGNQQLTEFWCTVIAAYPTLTPTHQQVLRAVLELIHRPGGSALMAALALDGWEPPTAVDLVRLIQALRPAQPA